MPTFSEIKTAEMTQTKTKPDDQSESEKYHSINETGPSGGCGHRRRSGWTSGGTHGERRRWVGAKWGGVWEGCPLSSQLKGLGERRELPQRGPGQSPGRKRILAYFEVHRTLTFVPI